MSYPLIIFGAGASFDCVQEEYENTRIRDGNFLVPKSKYKPPLTEALFREEFIEYLNKYKNVASLASGVPRSSNENFEEYLTRIQNEIAPKNEERYKQLVQLRYYLSELFKKITDAYYCSINNYDALLNTVKDNSGGIFINFNYDLLFEKNIESIFNGKTIDSYIADKDIKVIKIHGAYNWVNIIDHLPSNSENNNIVLDKAKDIHTQLNDENDQKHIYLSDDRNGDMVATNETGDKFYPITVPAIAIPISEKKNYICPESHIESLKASLGKIDRILIIGWKAGDQFIVNFINENLSGKSMPLGIVSPSGAIEISEKFPDFDYRLYEKGFTQFIKEGDFTDFMK